MTVLLFLAQKHRRKCWEESFSLIRVAVSRHSQLVLVNVLAALLNMAKPIMQVIVHGIALHQLVFVAICSLGHNVVAKS